MENLPKLIVLTVFYLAVFILTFTVNGSGGLDEALREAKTHPGFLMFVLVPNLLAAHGVWLFWRSARGSYSIAISGRGEQLAFDDICRRHPRFEVLIIGGLLLSIAGFIGAQVVRTIWDTGWNGNFGSVVSSLIVGAGIMVMVSRFKQWRYFWMAFMAAGFVYGGVEAAKTAHVEKPWPDEEQEFYGKVIDQDGHPVAGAKIKFESIGPSGAGPTVTEVSSNSHGHFTLGKKQAYGFTLSITKPGYTCQKRGAEFRFQNGNMLDGGYYIPFKSSPELYRMQKDASESFGTANSGNQR